jgi:5'-nucleotidase
MNRALATVAVSTVCLTFALGRSVPAQAPDTGGPRARAPVTFLQVNDVYETTPVDGLGGLAKLATIKQRLKDAGRTPLVVLAGDFLSSSVASTVFKGEQMITALNAAGLDLATLGNHEFDFGDDMLITRMREAKWEWVVSNVIDRRTNEPIGGAHPYLIKTFGTLKVGFIGLCLSTTEISKADLTHTAILDPLVTAARYIPILERQGVQAIVAITHLSFAEDRQLAERFPQITLIIGGHEHFPITAVEGRTFISKAGANARYVARIDLDRRASGTLERFFELMPVTPDIPDEPATAAVVRDYEARLGTALDMVVGETTVPLDAQSIRVRSAEQPIGNLIADAIREETHAAIALMNAGSIRGDRIYPAGPLTRRTLLAMHPFGNVITVIDVAGQVLVRALNAGVAKLPAAAGQFPQVSGMTFTVDANAPAGNRVRDVKIAGQPLEAAKSYTMALPDYILDGGDGYDMFGGSKVIVGPESGPLIVTALEKYIAAKKTISPQIENRITINK